MAVRQRRIRQVRRDRRAAERWLAVAVALLAVATILPARADDCPPGTPPALDRRACTELARCLRAEPTASSTVSVTEQLYRAAARFERCALKGWARAVGEGDAHAILRAPAPTCPTIPTCPAVPECSAFDHLGAGAAICAACAGASSGLTAWAFTRDR